MYNVDVKINYENEELYCFECKGRIYLGEKYLIILEQLYSGEVEKRPIHLDCIPETIEDDEEENPFFHQHKEKI